MHNKIKSCTALTLCLVASHCIADEGLEGIVNAAVKPVMQQQQIAGLAIAITLDGEPHYFNYGIASKETGKAVTRDTLFEIGSVSKTFTATLAAYAQATGALSLSDTASHILPALRDSAFERITVLQLGTYTAGGLPLQFPQEADDAEKMLGYFQQWKPTYAAGTYRLYSNPSLGLFGYLAAHSMGTPFDQAMEATLLPKLGLSHTYLTVPPDQLSLYAQGYDKDNHPVRVGPGALDAEAYGLKTSAADLIGFVQANMQPTKLEEPLRQAIATTHAGYYSTGPAGSMTQGLGWEFYPYPVSLTQLISGNSPQMAFEAHKVNWLKPVTPPATNAWFNKTGATSGFGAYAAFVPSQNIGIVILANKNYPNAERVKIAHTIMSALVK